MKRRFSAIVLRLTVVFLFFRVHDVIKLVRCGRTTELRDSPRSSTKARSIADRLFDFYPVS
jgi:hypothetical protein